MSALFQSHPEYLSLFEVLKEPEVKPFDGLSDSQVAAVDEQIDLMEEA